MKEFNFNKLYILESLSPKKFADGYNAPNNNLIKAIDAVKGQKGSLDFF